MGTRKYQTFAQNERSIAGGAFFKEEVLTFEAPEDCTVVGVLVELAIAAEPLEPALVYEHGTGGGWIRLLVNRAGNVLPAQPNEDSDWDAVPGVGTLNDADNGDTWAITPFAVSAGGQADGNSGFGSNMRVTLAPKTARKLRRQDQLIAQVYYTNSGPNEIVIQEIVVGTLFVAPA